MDVQAFFDALGVPVMADHWKVMLGAALVWHLLYLSSRWVSKQLIPSFKTWPKNTQRDFGMRVTSFTNAVTVCSLAVPMFYDPVLYNDKLFGYTHYAGDVIAIILGYFIWDTYVSIQAGDFWFIVHGISAFTVFFLGYKPFLFYYGAVFVMYELSTPFLNIHWMCDKLGLTGSTLQLVNGIVLLFVFFGARIVFGLYASFDLFYELYSKADIIPVERAVVLFVLNSILNALNLFWFYKMIDSVRRRFAPSSTKVDGKASGRGSKKEQ